MHLYEDRGEGFLEPLNGQFAIALWDAGQRQLVVARDRFGIKPLYWTEIDGGLVFGSELKALLPHPQLPRQRDPRAIEDYFAYGYIPEPKTMALGGVATGSMKAQLAASVTGTVSTIGS